MSRSSPFLPLHWSGLICLIYAFWRAPASSSRCSATCLITWNLAYLLYTSSSEVGELDWARLSPSATRQFFRWATTRKFHLQPLLGILNIVWLNFHQNYFLWWIFSVQVWPVINIWCATFRWAWLPASQKGAGHYYRWAYRTSHNCSMPTIAYECKRHRQG